MARSEMDHFEDLLHCLICFDQYQNPKMLNCGHTFCQECLQGYYITYQQQRRAQPGRIPCPTCRELTALPSNGVQGLRNDFKVAKIEEMFRTVNVRARKLSRTNSTVCDPCKSQKKVASGKHYCPSCSMNYCDSCLRKHSKNPLFKEHAVADKNKSKDSDFYCKEHKDEQGKYFCSTCEMVICTVCIISAHDGHNVTEISEMLKKHKDDIHNLQNVVGDKLTFLQTRQREMEKLRGLNLSSCQQAELNIKDKANRLIDEIRKEEARMIQELHKKRDDKLEAISREINAVNFFLAKGNSLQDYAVSTAQKGSIRMMAVHEELIQRMRTVADLDTTTGTSNVKAVVTFLPGRQEISLGRIDEVLGTIDDLNRNPMIISPPPPRPTRSADALSNGGSRRSSASTNATPGPSTSSAAGPSTSSSSFDRTRIKPKKLIDIHRVGSNVGELKDPLGVAVLLNGDIAVAEWGNKRVQLFDCVGKPLNIVCQGKIGPQGVAVTLRGNIIATDAMQKRLMVFTPTGEILAKWGIGKFYAPCGVAVSPNGRCVVTDVEAHSISIHQGERKCLLQFGGRGRRDDQFNIPLYVAVGLHNEIIVSDSDNHCIKVFDSAGRFMHKFGREGSSDGQLTFPRGVTVDHEGNIIVADRNNDRVSLFTPNGRFVKHLLTREDGISDPYGVAMSVTRNLVVTESASGKASLKMFQMDSY